MTAPAPRHTVIRRSCYVTLQKAGEDPQACGLDLPGPRHPEVDEAWRQRDEREEQTWRNPATRPSGARDLGRLLMATTNRAALAVIRQDDLGHPPEFLEVDGGVVHVVCPGDATPQLVPDEHRGVEILMRLAVGDVWTVCGKRISRHRGGFDGHARFVSRFDDERLCRSCWAPFGAEEGHRLFDANAGDDEDA